jgi:hypothetical protein
MGRAQVAAGHGWRFAAVYPHMGHDLRAVRHGLQVWIADINDALPGLLSEGAHYT